MRARTREREVDLPVGAVIPYAGAVDGAARDRLARHGWLVCDGSAVYRLEHPELFRAIGTSYGTPSGSDTDSLVFCLPDYRGVFLRGLDPTGKVDPEVQERTSANPNGSGNTGAEVGSRQGEAIQDHEHVYMDAAPTPSPPPPPPSPPPPPPAVLLGPLGDTPTTLTSYPAVTSAIAVTNKQPDTTETRPINVAINFLIKSRWHVHPPSCCDDGEGTEIAPSSS